MAVVVKNPPANTGDTRDVAATSGSIRPPWRMEWHPPAVFLRGESQGQRSLAGLQPMGSQVTEHEAHTRLQFYIHLCICIICTSTFVHLYIETIGEGSGNPQLYSCLENPRNRGAWWAAVYGVAQSRTRLKRLSSSSSSVSILSICLSRRIITSLYHLCVYLSNLCHHRSVPSIHLSCLHHHISVPSIIYLSCLHQHISIPSIIYLSCLHHHISILSIYLYIYLSYLHLYHPHIDIHHLYIYLSCVHLYYPHIYVIYISIYHVYILICRVHHVKCQAGWSTSWNQDCLEKYQ